ncbi:hypothetical protein PACTADRAFT_47957 [Pachysolen tannophilus NRRL Y-2460]|uniref:COX assembly mitochondrial protein n=1 Tax=Pachysolen tannophilus NRRL Y-2460 TaxID=669874 RepID=A0A1E4U2D5_PACTA|nr:hypothetical protein PACTADRAFT_47957 [Pachysolen tannophilus NRRL Y-2460]
MVEQIGSDDPPVWLLTPKEEKEAFENWRVNTWKNCDDEVREFAECGKLAGYGVWFKCRDSSKKMKDCIKKHQTSEYVDIERDLIIQRKIKKRQEQQKLNNQ